MTNKLIGEEYHTFERGNRKAIVYKNKNRFYVNLMLKYDDVWAKVQTREVFEHSEIYAENVAENYVDGLLNVKDDYRYET